MRSARQAIAALCLLLGACVGDLRALAQEATPEFANVFSTLHKFSSNGNWPRGGVAIDSAGNIFGTTLYGGNCSTCGVIYELVKPKTGTVWTYKILHKFVLGPDGIAPTGPLTIARGKIYGTTSAGANPSCGCGEVFSLTPSGSTYVYQVIHRFDRTHGTTPVGGVLVAADGTIYGTTAGGGRYNSGLVYKISANGAYTILHNFAGNYTSGPQGELTFGKDGAIYGATFSGGRYNQGAVFRLTTGGAYSVLYDFKGIYQIPQSRDGANPEGRLAIGPDGTIYGTTSFGGNASGYGTAYSLKPPTAAGSAWTYKQIYVFGQGSALPNTPHSGFIRDGAGNLYGTSAGGGARGGGTLYKLSPPTSGTLWTQRVLVAFKPLDAGGDVPYAVLGASAGALYGTTLTGGDRSANCPKGLTGCGTVFVYK
jgi:uncharacterized repeat protein (TIGR03803 family)